MSAAIVARSETSFTVQVEIPYSSSMLDFEEVIQDRLNQAGVVATGEALQQFDTDGWLTAHDRLGQVHPQRSIAQGGSDPLRRRHRQPPRLPEPAGR
jgi:hypothetical protein